MSIQIVPTSGTTAAYKQRTTLEGTTFVLSFMFNQRCQAWYLSLADVNGIDIYNGIKLMVGLTLLRHKCADLRRPKGDFIVFDATGRNTPPGLLDLLPNSGRCTLYYITSDWIATIKAGKIAALFSQVAANTQSSAMSTYGQK